MGRKTVTQRGSARLLHIHLGSLLCIAALFMLVVNGVFAQPVLAAADDSPLADETAYAWQGISLLCRILSTFGAELVLAIVFRFNNKSQLLFIAVVNAFTLTLSQAGLNVYAYCYGTTYFFQCACVFYVISFALEGLLYQCVLRPLSDHPEKKLAGIWLYSLTANFVSLMLGTMIAAVIPGLM